MYSKDELLSKNIAELEEIAEQIGIKVKSDDSQEDIIYSILDKQAEVEGNKNPLGTKRRRVRIVKKDTDRVYSVNGKEGENFDLKRTRFQLKHLRFSMIYHQVPLQRQKVHVRKLKLKLTCKLTKNRRP